MCLSECLRPVCCVPLDVERVRGHPTVRRNAVQLKVGLAPIDPQVWPRATELGEIVLGRFDGVVVASRVVALLLVMMLQRDVRRSLERHKRVRREQGRPVVGKADKRSVDLRTAWQLGWRDGGSLWLALPWCTRLAGWGRRSRWLVRLVQLAHLIDVGLRQVDLLA